MVIQKRTHARTQKTLPDSQFLLSLCSLQDVDEVFQVVEIFGPGQPATHCAHHFHRCRYHVFMLQYGRIRGVRHTK